MKEEERTRGAALDVIRQQAQQEEAKRAVGEGKLRYYPLEGEDLIENVTEASLETLPEALLEAFAFREGLIFGPDLYDLKNPEQSVFLMNLFTTVESATKRPSEYYLDAAINEQVGKGSRLIKKKARKEKRPLDEGENRQISTLMGYQNWNEARKIIDEAFIQRMRTCHNDETAANLLKQDNSWRPPISPDKGHWQAFFGITSKSETEIKTPQREFGEAVDRVLRAIVATGNPDQELARVKFSLALPDGRIISLANNKIVAKSPGGKIISILDREKLPPTIYATGFATSEQFKDWLSCLLEVANGRMDVVLAAWKLALIFELPSQFGHQVDEEHKHDIGLPPIVNDLFTWTMFLEEKRALEWGLDEDGERVRNTKYPTHSGYPLSLGKLVRRDTRGKPRGLCESYFHETEVKIPGSKKKTTLWEEWWEKKTSLADPKFPWLLTEVSPAEAGREEAPPGSYQGWLLRRMRAFSVVSDIRSGPGLGDLANPEFFGKKVRIWDKVFGEIKDKPPEENPRAWWVAGLIMAHHLEANNRIPLVKNSPDELAYRTYFPGEVWSTVQKGQPGSRTPSIWEILNHAYQCRFLRKSDIEWLISNLNLPKPMLGASPY